MENGASAEIAVVGMTESWAFHCSWGASQLPVRAVVQSAGRGFRLKAQVMKDEFNRGGSVLHLLLRYTPSAYYSNGTNRSM